MWKEITVGHSWGSENAVFILKNGEIIGCITPYGRRLRKRVPTKNIRSWDSRSGLSWEHTFLVDESYEIVPMPTYRKDASPLFSMNAYVLPEEILYKSCSEVLAPIWVYDYQKQEGEVELVELKKEYVISHKDFTFKYPVYVYKKIVILTQLSNIEDGDFIGVRKGEDEILVRGRFKVREGEIYLTLFAPRAKIKREGGKLSSTSVIRPEALKDIEKFYIFDKSMPIELKEKREGFIVVSPAVAVYDITKKLNKEVEL